MKPIAYDNRTLRKTAISAIIVNALQILAVLGFVLYVIIGLRHNTRYLQIILLFCTVMTLWGAVLDILDAVKALHQTRDLQALEQSNQEMDAFNLQLRAQRHDFMNQLQVIYSLIEMEEYAEATAYIERTYQNIGSINRFLRTKVTAFNALLQVKSAVCQEKGITFDMQIHSSLEDVPVPAWELCCVMGNLIDNAIDALHTTADPLLRLAVQEDMQQYTLRLQNNGPLIPEAMRTAIFERGISEKGEGRGLGLSIARETLAPYNATLTLEAEPQTAFIICIPKQHKPALRDEQ